MKTYSSHLFLVAIIGFRSPNAFQTYYSSSISRNECLLWSKKMNSKIFICIGSEFGIIRENCSVKIIRNSVVILGIAELFESLCQRGSRVLGLQSVSQQWRRRQVSDAFFVISVVVESQLASMAAMVALFVNNCQIQALMDVRSVSRWLCAAFVCATHSLCSLAQHSVGVPELWIWQLECSNTELEATRYPTTHCQTERTVRVHYLWANKIVSVVSCVGPKARTVQTVADRTSCLLVRGCADTNNRI